MGNRADRHLVGKIARQIIQDSDLAIGSMKGRDRVLIRGSICMCQIPSLLSLTHYAGADVRTKVALLAPETLGRIACIQFGPTRPTGAFPNDRILLDDGLTMVRKIAAAAIIAAMWDILHKNRPLSDKV